jgi:hypothetical protein
MNEACSTYRGPFRPADVVCDVPYEHELQPWRNLRSEQRLLGKPSKLPSARFAGPATSRGNSLATCPQAGNSLSTYRLAASLG